MPGAKKSATAKTTASSSKTEAKVDSKVVEVNVEPKKETVEPNVKPQEKKTAAKKTKTVKVEEPAPEPEPEVIETCTEESCAPTHEEVEEAEEQEDPVEEVEEYEEAEVEEGEEAEEEEYEEEEEVDEEEVPELEKRDATVPTTSMTSPRKLAASNRFTSPRLAGIRSPMKVAPRVKKDHYARYGALDVDDCLYGEDDIMQQVFEDYINIRGAEVITWLKTLDRCAYYFKTDGRVSQADGAEEAIAVQISEEIEECFEVFECIAGVLAFSPWDDLDFGGEDNPIALRRVPGYVYIALVISAGPSGGDIRFLDEFDIRGLIPLEKYEAMKGARDYRQQIKSTKLKRVEDF